MTESHRTEIEILGQRYTIRSEASPDYVRELAAYVDARVKEIRGDGPGQDPVKLLALAALYIADELFRLRDESARSEGEASARVGALLQLLDAMVPPGRP
jgi:cell division protein ZapA